MFGQMLNELVCPQCIFVSAIAAAAPIVGVDKAIGQVVADLPIPQNIKLPLRVGLVIYLAQVLGNSIYKTYIAPELGGMFAAV